MFCCGELSPQLTQKQFDPAFWQPSEYDAMLVKATWSDNEDDLSDLGASIYTYIFENYPEVKNFFPKIHQHGAKWKESKEFHMQGFIFAQTLSKVVDNVAQTDLVKPFLYKIGARHVSYAKLGFRPQHWDLFQEAMAQVMADKIRTTEDYLDNTQKSDAIAVWSRLAIFIVDNLKVGYDETRFFDPEYKIFQGLLYVEFVFLIFAIKVLLVTLFIVFKHPQFHWNLIGIKGNAVIIYLVLVLCRLLQMISISLDPNKDAIDWKPDDMPFEYYLDNARATAMNCYILMILSLAVERTLATFMLKSYEDFNNPVFLIIIVPSQWGFGFFIEYSITKRMWDGISWGIFILVILFGSLLWLVLLHYINQYRYNNRITHAYNLKERFQLSENIRFLKMVKWSVITLLIGDVIAVIVFIWANSNDEYDHFQFTTYNFTLVFNAIALPIVSILTNTVWRKELIIIIKSMRVCRRNAIEDSDQNHRFNAPYIRSLTGNPMVFSVDQERNLYYNHLQNQWQS